MSTHIFNFLLTIALLLLSAAPRAELRAAETAAQARSDEKAELGISGDATVQSIAAAPAIADGPGRVVLGTFTHLNNQVLEIRFEGHERSLKATAEHLLYSASRDDWVPAGEVEPGEELLTDSGVVVVTRVQPLPGLLQVFNLEVEGDHQYFAGDAQVLSHNSGGCGKRGVPSKVYRAGSATDANLTPRPVDTGGLSATIDQPPGKFQVIDPTKLEQLEVIQDGANHASIRPIDQARMGEWIDSRGADSAHEFTQDLRNAIIGTGKGCQ